MSIFSFLKKRTLENPAQGLSYNDLLGYGPTYSGEAVTPNTAMKITAVLACVRVLAESIASLSWFIYERIDGGGKQRAYNHPLFTLLHDRPNPMMSSFNYRERMMKDLLLEGNHFSLIDYNQYGQIEALWPLDPRSVRIALTEDGREPAYFIRTNKYGAKPYNYKLVFHLSILGDGLVGKSLISYSAESLGLSLSQDKYSSTFYGNGAFPGGVLESDKPISKDARERLKTGWEQTYGKNSQGSGWHRVAVLEEGLKWKPMTVNPKDAMILESKEFQITDIARIFRVPPHLIGDLRRSTYNNIEHQSTEFVVYTLQPWVIRIEQEADYKLILPEERKQFFNQFLIDSMLRGDAKSRNEAFQIMRQNGVLNANEWRERENLNPLPGDQGEKYIYPQNMGLLSQLGKEKQE